MRTKIIERIKKQQLRNYSFHYLTRNIVRGLNHSIKRLYENDAEGNRITIHLDRITIESKLLDYNEKYYKKVISTNAYKDKIHDKL